MGKAGCFHAGFVAAEGPGAKGCRQPVETGKADFLWTPRKNATLPSALVTSEVTRRKCSTNGSTDLFAFEPSISWRNQPTSTMILGRQMSLILDFWPLGLQHNSKCVLLQASVFRVVCYNS